MTTLPIYDMTGTQVGDYEIDPQMLAPKVSKQLLHDVVVMYLANQRQGSNKTKSRGEVSGSTKKIYKQKGTGNARMGAKRNPVRRGGGHASGWQQSGETVAPDVERQRRPCAIGRRDDALQFG